MNKNCFSNPCFSSADILLPDFTKVDGEKWAVIACDQFTSEPAYWEQAEAVCGDAPSTLRMILPEIYLEERGARLPSIHNAMREYADGTLLSHPDSMLYLCRRIADGRVRRGLIGKIDLECYDYKKDSAPLIRATEGTVLERIPPRVEIREGAPLELPHVMLLMDDPTDSVFNAMLNAAEPSTPAYSFPLMLSGGSVDAAFLSAEQMRAVDGALAALWEKSRGEMASPFLFAVGDGNHSLAAAKAHYENIKAIHGDAAALHPARYALVELCNLHEESLCFEPIYRVVFGADTEELLDAFSRFAAEDGEGTHGGQEVLCIAGELRRRVTVSSPRHFLTVGSLQTFLDGYLAAHPACRIDYIHGEDAVEALCREEGAIGFLFDGMQKEQLFPAVAESGALPRKTFSMGEARDKRYYIESRSIVR